jgi:hypothetical protein
MANNRFLEFDSAYRDRQQYSNPASFVVEISQSGQKTKLTAIDPVSNASPILWWNTSFRNDVDSITLPVASIVTSGTSPTDYSILDITAVSGRARRLNNFYNGALIVFTSAGVDTYRRIVKYDWRGNNGAADTATIVIDSALPDGYVFAGATALITRGGSNTITALVPQVFIPLTDAQIPNFYVNYSLFDVASGRSYRITSYESTTRLATLANNTTVNYSAAPNAQLAIVKEPPISLVTIEAMLSIGPPAVTTLARENLAVMQFTSVAPVTDQTGNFLRITTPTPAFPYDPVIPPYGQERRIVKYVTGDGTMAAVQPAGGFNFTLTGGSGDANNLYVGSIITANGESHEIITYDHVTRQGTIATPWIAPIAIGDVWFIRTATVSRLFVPSPVVGVSDVGYLEQYSRDNAVPFSYSGTLVSSQEEVCYEVELLNLILPNTVLASGRGGRPAFYPYLYVELQAVSGPSGLHRSTIYSNNPNAERMLFRAVVDDTPTPLISPFIKIDGDGMIHTIKFKPNDSFKFSVYHANGELFKTAASDTTSPTEPNPLLQISACFAFKRT